MSKYKRIEIVDLESILGQAAQVIDYMSEVAVSNKDTKAMLEASSLWMELAKYYIEKEPDGDAGDVTGDYELSEQGHEPMGFRPNDI